MGGTLGGLSLSPDRAALYYLNLTAGTASRLDTAALKRGRQVGDDIAPLSEQAPRYLGAR